MNVDGRDKWSGSKRRVLAVRASGLSSGSSHVVGRISSLDILGENYIHHSGGGIPMAVVVIDFSSLLICLLPAGIPYGRLVRYEA